MAALLWTGAPPPMEYITLILCRDVYHCTPSQLRQERLVDVLPHLTALQVEAQVARLQAQRSVRDKETYGGLLAADSD